MPDKPNQRGRQMTFRESDGRIVPLKSGSQLDGMKPSNIGAGKAARPIRDADRAPSVLRDGSTVINRPDHITTERRDAQVPFRCCRPAQPRVVHRRHNRHLLGGPIVTSEAWEPDALTAHGWIYEGATSIVHGSNILTPPQETRWQTGKTNRILNTRE